MMVFVFVSVPSIELVLTAQVTLHPPSSSFIPLHPFTVYEEVR